MSPLSAKEAQLVHDGWEIVVMPNYEKHAMDLFLEVFSREPAIMERFPFLKDMPDGELLENNIRLQKHATIALLMVGDAIACFNDEEEATQVKKRLYLLGRLHTKFGLQDTFFSIVGEAFMDVITKAFRSMWNGEMEHGWKTAIGIVTSEMTRGLKDAYAAHA